jgi:predicted enzyme related to lactoylglutathione lyase
MEETMLEVSQLLLPVQNIDTSLTFYETVLGLELGFRDGDRYATLKAGSVKLALAAPAERLPDQGSAAAFKVPSLEAVIERLVANGLDEPAVIDGAHERSIEIKDPDGHAVLFYQPK